MTTYLIHDADWQSGRVSVTRPDTPPMRISLGELRWAAEQPDADLAATYSEIYRRAGAALEASRRASVARCSGHRAVTTEDGGYLGPIADAEENRSAHGCITRRETCRCGAERRTNINQNHYERGWWR